MIWMAVGCRYRESDLALRERLAFSNAQIHEALELLRHRYPELEVVILSTCNRVEIYAAMEISSSKKPDANAFPHDAAEGAARLATFLAEFHGLNTTEVIEHLFQKTGRDVAEHLFSVAASLDSMVVGEAQIAGQVRAAYELAVECDAVGPLLHIAFQRAAAIAKKVTTQTAIHQYRTSIPSVAVSCFARQIFEHLSKKTALVLGAGQMAEETLRYLRDEGIGRILIVNRSADKAERLAMEFGGIPLHWERLGEAMIQSDMILSLTGASEPIVTLSEFKKLVAKRDCRPLLILDLAVPRDFEASIAAISNVYLYTVDDLKLVCDENRTARANDLPAAAAIVQQELDRFILDIRHHKSGHVIEQLRQRWREVKKSEAERLFHKHPELNPRQREEIDNTMERLMNKLLHIPMESLRDEAGAGLAPQRGLLDALRKLFGL